MSVEPVEDILYVLESNGLPGHGLFDVTKMKHLFDNISILVILSWALDNVLVFVMTTVTQIFS